jgi:hypothetical protein
MHVKHFYTWGYFFPITCGADVVAANQLEYFRERGWSVDCVLANDPRKGGLAGRFRDKYRWVDSVTVVDLPPCAFTFRDQLFAYERVARLPEAASALGGPADLFFTNYVFTSPLLRAAHGSCKRVLESVDILAPQFALAERDGRPQGPGAGDPLAAARQSFLLRTELDLYRLYDAVIMINPEELAFARSRGVANASYVPQAYAPPQAAGPATSST